MTVVVQAKKKKNSDDPFCWETPPERRRLQLYLTKHNPREKEAGRKIGDTPGIVIE